MQRTWMLASLVVLSGLACSDDDGRLDPQTPSVELVDPVENLIANYARGPDGCKVTLEHGAALGYPQRVHVECSEESYTRSIDCFIADTLDVSRCQ